MVDRGMAGRCRGTGQVLAVQPAGPHVKAAAGAVGETALADRARLPRDQDRPRVRPLRRPYLAGLAPPRHPGLGRTRLLHPATPGPKSSSAAVTLYGALRRMQPLLVRLLGTCPTCGTPFPQPK